QTAFDEPVDFVALPLYDGELGILPGRAPMIGRLGYGELRIRQGNRTLYFYIDGGFAQVADNVVSVLTNRAIAPERINTTAPTRPPARGRTTPPPPPQQPEPPTPKTAPTDEPAAERDRHIAQARGQLHVASKK